MGAFPGRDCGLTVYQSCCNEDFPEQELPLTMMLFSELRRRNVFRVTLLYFTAGWLLLELCSLFVDYAGMPLWVLRFLFALLIIAFPLAIGISWFYEITPDGLRRESLVDPTESITKQTGARLLRLALLCLLLVFLLNLLRFALD
jgi:hypothetical protein